MRCRHLAGIGWVLPGWAGEGRSRADLLLGSDYGQRKGRGGWETGGRTKGETHTERERERVS